MSITKKTNSCKFYLWLLAIFILIHRIAILWIYRNEFTQLISENPWWFTWQYLDLDNLRYDLFHSILYLQQTPPVPNLLFGIGLQLPNWQETTYFFILLQTLFTLIAGILMFIILSEFTQKFIFIFLWICFFIFGSDLLVMEYNIFGQSFYENLTMCLLLILALLFLRWLKNPNYKTALLMGMFVGLAALSRATYSYFFLLPLFGFFTIRIESAFKHVACYVLGVLFFQGTWAIKNYCIYDYLSPTTSSWQGLNLSVGLSKVGFQNEFINSILKNPNDHPEWFINMVKNDGLPSWGNFPTLEKYLPGEIEERDQAIDSKLGHFLNAGNSNNSVALYVLSREYSKAYFQFVQDHTTLVLKKLWVGYAQFWMPIHTYSEIVMPFFHTTAPRLIIGMGDLFPPFIETTRKYLAAYLSPEQTSLFLKQGKFGNPSSSIPAGTITLPYVSGLASLLNLVMFNLLIPCLLVYLLITCQLKSPANIFLLFLFASIAYLAFCSSLVEFGENMRFRLSVEPLLWLSTFLALLVLFDNRTKKSPKAKVY